MTIVITTQAWWHVKLWRHFDVLSYDDMMTCEAMTTWWRVKLWRHCGMLKYDDIAACSDYDIMTFEAMTTYSSLWRLFSLSRCLSSLRCSSRASTSCEISDLLSLPSALRMRQRNRKEHAKHGNNMQSHADHAGAQTFNLVLSGILMMMYRSLHFWSSLSSLVFLK
jgi:hypothetical protein